MIFKIKAQRNLSSLNLANRGFGSVVALSDSDGDSCQSYEYSVYGQVAASDPNFLANPYMFTGQRFDIEIRRPGLSGARRSAGRAGLYYYRARYYNPHIGRFMQTDPVGYSEGMNLYVYCNNNPTAYVDPSGCLLRVTGQYWTMPGHNNYPGKSMAADILAQMAKLVVNVIETSEIGDKDPRVKVVKTYFEILEKTASAVAKLQPADCWRTFIEVRDCNDKNGDGIIDPNEKSDLFWIEVRGFRMPDNSGACWLEGGGYETWGEAADAGGSLVYYALQNGGVIPDNIPAGWLAPSWEGSPYITNERYYVDEEFVELLKTMNELLEEWND